VECTPKLRPEMATVLVRRTNLTSEAGRLASFSRCLFVEKTMWVLDAGNADRNHVNGVVPEEVGLRSYAIL
jgi:hypothetical protein